MSKGEVLVDGTHARRPFADGCGDALDRACPDVANGEQPRMAGLEGQRQSAKIVPVPAELPAVKGAVGEHEAPLDRARRSPRATPKPARRR